MDGRISGRNLAAQDGLHPLHGVGMHVNQSGQNRAPAQVQRLGAGTGATRKRAVVADSEDSAVAHCHGSHHRIPASHGNDVPIAQEKVGVAACLGHAFLDHARSQADSREQ